MQVREGSIDVEVGTPTIDSVDDGSGGAMVVTGHNSHLYEGLRALARALGFSG